MKRTYTTGSPNRAVVHLSYCFYNGDLYGVHNAFEIIILYFDQLNKKSLSPIVSLVSLKITKSHLEVPGEPADFLNETKLFYSILHTNCKGDSIDELSASSGCLC